MGNTDKRMRNIDIRLAPSDLGEHRFCLQSSGRVQGCAGDHFEWRDTDGVLIEAVLAGHGYLSIGKHTWRVEAGDLYVLSREPARYGSDLKEPWSKVFFTASGPLVQSLLPLYLHGITLFKKVGLDALLRELHQVSKDGGPDVNERASILFLDLLIQISRLQAADSACSEEVCRVLRYIDEHYEHPISVDDLARHVSMSKAHLIRIFHAQVGVTPYEQVIQRRIEASKILLRTTSLRLKEIAARLCFADEYYFSTTFKKRVGRPPSAYRKRTG